jgi:two-component system, response regulator PdtaR
VEKIIVAFESEKTLDRFCEILEGGCVVNCLKAHSAGEVKRIVAKQHIGTVVCGFKLRDESAEDLFYDLPPASAMLVVARQDMLENLSEDIFTLPAPASRSDLCASVNMVMQMSHRLEHALRPKRNEEETDTVEKAKRHLMERDGLSEEEAHRYIQKKSMDNGAKMVQTAVLVLEDRC